MNTDVAKYGNEWNIHNDLKNHGLFSLMLLFSVVTFFIVLFDFSRPVGYEFLFLLPVSFLLFMFIVSELFDEIPYNLGLSLIFIMQFIRLVISPLFLVLSNYGYVISLNISQNTPKAILLMVYESFAIAMALRLSFKKRKHTEYFDIDSRSHNRRMNLLFSIVMIGTGILTIIAPQILSNYRTILGLFTDSDFVTVEQSYIIESYSTTFLRKFALVTSNYVLKVLRLLIPLYLMVILKRHLGRKAILPCFILVCSPMIFVDGAIARSLYYIILLFIIFLSLFDIGLDRMYGVIFVGACFVTCYFVMRFTFSDSNFFEFMSYKFVDYFGGLNIVSGSYNLPVDSSLRFHYFIGDILRMVPFANTLFGLDSGDIMPNFFNSCNNMTGCIPSTVGMGAYYFGFLLAPVYSFLFARASIYYGRKYQSMKNPYYKMVYLFISFITALGIGIYNHEIVLGILAQVIFPLYIITRLAYPKNKA